MRGGHANSGPAPDPNAIRRDRQSDQAAWITLPAGRDGATPPWPLTESTKREDAMWERLWKTPQATQWEALAAFDEVAMYVRTFVEAAEPGASADKRKLARTLMEDIGLSVTGLARRHWRLTGSTDTQQENKRAGSNRRPSAKDRFAVIEGRRTA
jgi:hypothetical protein